MSCFVFLYMLLFLHASLHGRRRRRILENKQCVDEERIESCETLLRQARQVASEAEARFDEVCSR